MYTMVTIVVAMFVSLLLYGIYLYQSCYREEERMLEEMKEIEDLSDARTISNVSIDIDELLS